MSCMRRKTGPRKKPLTKRAPEFALQPWRVPDLGDWERGQHLYARRVWQRLVRESEGVGWHLSDLLLVPPGKLSRAQVAWLKLMGVWSSLVRFMQREGGQFAEDYLQAYRQHGWPGVLRNMTHPLLQALDPWFRNTQDVVGALVEAFVFYHHGAKLWKCRYGPHLFVAPGRGAPPEVCPFHQPLALRERVYRHRQQVSTQRKVGNTLATLHAQKGASRCKGAQKSVGRNARQK